MSGYYDEENRLKRLLWEKEKFLDRVKDKWRDAILIEFLKSWQEECKYFSEFEEIYITAKNNLIPESFFFEWLDSTKIYEEKMQIYACTVKNCGFCTGQAIIKVWLEECWDEIPYNRENQSKVENLVYRGDDEFKQELKLILKTY